MLVKPGDYNWGTFYGIHRRPQIGGRVCRAANTQVLGKIVALGPEQHYYHRDNDTKYISQMDIYWMTGSRKGQIQRGVEARAVLDYDGYKAKLLDNIRILDENEAEAAKTGM